jgi:rhamnosyltransferase
VGDVAIVVPTLRGGARLLEALDAIAAQESALVREVLCVDSGSPPGELEAMRARGARVESIPPASFDHGLTRDLGAARSSGRVLVFLNQDAVPGHRRWLDELVEPLLDGDQRVVAVQGGIREIPAVERRFFWDSCGPRFYFTRESRRWIAAHDGIGFSTVNCALRRSAWERFPFEAAPILEDKRWQGRVHAAGLRIVARHEAFVYHTHNYGRRALVRRCVSEGFGWRWLGERYRAGDMLADMLQPAVYREWLHGLGVRSPDGRRIHTGSELLFPWLRPIALWWGNRVARRARF